MNRLLKSLFTITRFKRFLFFMVFDIALIAFSLYLSFLFDFDCDVRAVQPWLVLEVLPYFGAMKLICLGMFRVYGMTWRYAGIFDLAHIMAALALAAFALMLLCLPAPNLPFKLAITGFPKRIVLVDFIISLFLISGLRISKRFYLEVVWKKRFPVKSKRTIIIGAGNTGEMVMREIVRGNYSEFYPVGFLDNDRSKLGTYIHGVKVIDTTERLGDIIPAYEVDAVIVAIPSLNRRILKDIHDTARRLNVSSTKIVPRIYTFNKPDIDLRGLEDISIEDLVGRQSISIDYNEIGKFLAGKSVLITGAGGSIGSEIACQVCVFKPESVILFDIDETELHNLGLRLGRLFPEASGKLNYVTGDIRDEIRLEEVFGEYKPRIVFHAAAYKHVPMMEHNPKEAVKVNMFGTHGLAKTARDHGVEKFIMISSDKAVRPTSIMGATKRMAEYICAAFGTDANNPAPPDSGVKSIPLTEFVSVRFGNVLGSRGSVLPLFLDQLRHGGPLTVTHRDMRRYFMTIPEAVSLVLQASVVGRGGEVLVLDMGEPVAMTHVAEELIRIHGLEPYKDIDITFTGLRPGEKLFEEILTAEEGTVASKHEKVFVARNGKTHSLPEMQGILDEFREAVTVISAGSADQVRALLKKHVRHYENPAHLPETGQAGEKTGLPNDAMGGCR